MATSSGDIALRLTIGAVNSASGVIGSLAKELANLAGSGGMGAVTAGGIVAGAAVIGLGVASVKAAGDFQHSMTSLVTDAGEAKGNIGMVGDGILKIATDTGSTTKDLVAGMYQIESSGIHGADALKVLQASAEGAKVGNADLETVAKAVTTVMTDYHEPASKAVDVTNALITTVSLGKTHLQDLSKAMGTVLPVASAMGVKFPDVAAGMAMMTNSGMTAQKASMNLANAIRNLGAPSAAAQKAMASVGISAQDLKDTLSQKGLAGAIQMIEDHISQKFPAGSIQATNALKTIMGGATGLNVALVLGGKNMSTYEADIKKISASLNAGAKDVDNWSTVTQTLNFQIDRLKAAFEVLLIKIGTALLPVVTIVVKGLADIVTALGDVITAAGKFGDFIVQSFNKVGDNLKPLIDAFKAIGGVIAEVAGALAEKLKPAFDAVGGALGKVGEALQSFQKWMASSRDVANLVVAAIIGIAVALTAKAIPAIVQFLATLPEMLAGIAAWAADMLVVAVETIIAMAPYLLIAAIVAAAVFIILEVITHWAEISKVLVAAWDAVAQWFQQTLPKIGAWFQSVWKAIVKAAEDAWKAVQNAWGAVGKWFQDIGAAIAKAFEDAWKAVQNAWGAVGKWFEDIGAAIMKALGGAWDWIKKTAGTAWDATKTAAKTGWDNIVKTVQAGANETMDIFKWLYEHNTYIKKMTDDEKIGLGQDWKWMQQGWQASTQWTVDRWNWLATQAKTIWQKIADFTKNTTKTVGDWIKQAWTDVTKWIADKWTWLVNQAKSIWQKIADFVKSVVGAVVDWLKQVWTDVTTWIAQKWGWLGDQAHTLWQKISDAIQTGTKAVVDWLKQAWADVAKWWDTFWQGIVDRVTGAWKAVGDTISQAWSKYIVQPFNTLLQNINQWFQGMLDAAKKFGENLMKAIADGIKNGVGAIGKALHDAISQALGALGFVGIPGFAGGVQNFQGGWAVVGERGPELLFLPSGSSVIPSGNPPPVASPPPITASSTGGSSSSDTSDQPMIIYNVLDGKQISKVVTTYQTRELRVQGVIRGI